MIKLKIGDTVFLEDINVHAIVQSVGQILHTGGTVETFFKENGVIEKVLGQREMPRVVIELQQVEVDR